MTRQIETKHSSNKSHCWKQIKLKYVCSAYSSNISAKDIDLDLITSYPVFGASGVMGYVNYYLEDNPYIGIIKDGAGVGRVNCYPGKSSLLSTLTVIKPNNNINLYWLKYILISMDLGKNVDKTTIPHIYFSDYGNKKISMPGYKEQEQIADFLDEKVSKIDEILAKTKQSIEEYKRLKQAVITQAVTKGLDPNVEMKDSGIDWVGEIPVNWNKIKITRLLDYTNSYPIGDGDHGLIGPNDYISDGIPYIRVQNLGWGTELDLSNVVYISEEKNQLIKKSILKPQDVVFAKTGATIGKTGYIPDSLPISNTTSHVGKITIDKNTNAKYVFYFLSSFLGYKQFWKIAIMKTTRPELSNDEVKSIFVILPSSKADQDTIVRYLETKCNKIDSILEQKEQLIKELESYKKSLIYEYVTGKKEVV